MVKVHYMDGDEVAHTKTGRDRREALRAHGDEGGTGYEYAENPAGGCYMAAEYESGAWSVFGSRGWSRRCPTLWGAKCEAGVR
jgi:hypothetical protein